ncbi:MAG: GNAT family N-acetyltransferase [Paracoccaceae bacterium]
MNADPANTRQATEEDYDQIHELLEAAFEQPDEATLVRQLREDGDMWLELVKDWDGRIAAYAALSRLHGPETWACLAPVAVWPAFQRGACAPEEDLRGHFSFGSRLVREIAVVADTDRKPVNFPDAIVVLGDPGFYGKAGFSLEQAQKLKTPYPVDHTLIVGVGTDTPDEELIYPPAFGAT